MSPQPEQTARAVDALLTKAGWRVCDASAVNIHAAAGVAIREFPLPGFGYADYLLYINGQAAGVIEAKKEGVTLTGVETQSDKYTMGLPNGLPCWNSPLPFSYQSTGVETRFTNGLDPAPRSRPVFAFHKPELLALWLEEAYTPTRTGDLFSGQSQQRQTADAALEQQSRNFLSRTWVPKTLIFAKDDAHAENIVEIVREDKSAGQPIWSHAGRPLGDGTRMCRRQFGKGNDFAQKITYLTTDTVEAASRRLDFSWDDQSLGFLNPYAPIDISCANLPHWRQDGAMYFVTFRLADSIPAEKLDIWRNERDRWIARNPKPWTIAQEREYYERFSVKIEYWLDQGVGGCVLEIPEVAAIVTGALRLSDGDRYRLGKFVVAVNHVHVLVTPLPQHELSDILHAWKSYTSKQILIVETASRRFYETKRRDAASTAVSTVWQKEYYDRIVRTPEELYHIEQYIERHAEYMEASCRLNEKRRDAASTSIRTQIVLDAVKPLHDPKLRELIAEIKKKNEIVIDIIRADEVFEATPSPEALDRAKGMVQSFEQFIKDHKDEITALQVLYSKPYKHRLTFAAVKELADAIEKPPYLWNESQLWNAYAALEKSKVKGTSGKRILTDLVSLVRFAIHQDNELIPFPERVNANFKSWVEAASRRLNQRQDAATGFTAEQMKWLEMIRDHIAANLSIEPDDFEYAPFSQHGGLGKVHQLFGDKLNVIIEEINETLAA